MRISHDKAFVYMAVTKTGSTTVRNLLNKYSDVKSESAEGPFGHHRTAAELRKTFSEQGWNWEKYFKFSVVRHPRGRLMSYHNYMHKIGSAPPSPYIQEHAMPFYEQCRVYAKFPTLDAAIQARALWLPPMTAFTHCPTTGNLLLDQWVKLEDLRNGLQSVWEKLNLCAEDLEDIPTLNASSPAADDDVVSTSSDAWIRDRFKTDLDAFGYE